MTPRAFSFNSPHGACPDCQGLGAMVDFDPHRVVPDESKSLADGAIAPWARGDRKLVREALQALRRDFGIDLTVPFAQAAAQSSASVCCSVVGATGKTGSKALLPNLRRRFEEGSWAEQEELEPYRSLRPCPACHGQRLKRAEPVGARSRGGRSADYVEPADRRGAARCSTALQLTDREALIAERILREIQDRLRFLNDVGVGYLTLGRSAATLSGGEGQRIRLATQIGANLTGVLYVLDEPSIGLHQRDNRKLLGDAVAAARSRQHRHRRRARRGDDPHRRLRHRSRPGRRRARRPRDLPGHARRADGRQRPATRRLADRRVPDRRAVDSDARRRRRPALKGELVIRGARANNLKNIDVRDPARRADGGHRRQRLRQVDARQRHPVQVARADALPGRRRAGRARPHRRHRAHRQGDRDRSVADRPHAALEPGDLHRALHVHPRSVRDDARRARRAASGRAASRST